MKENTSATSLFSSIISGGTPNTTSKGTVQKRTKTKRSMHYSRKPGIEPWKSPWPDQPYKRITIEIPLPLYKAIEKRQVRTNGNITKVQVITEALIKGLEINEPSNN